jgi:histidinol-phosphatase (PHP family)
MLYIKGKYYLLNANEELFSEILDLLGNDIKKLVKLYYKNLREAIKTKLFDVVGHFDLIKVFNENSKYFSDKDLWYKREVVKTLRLMRKFNLKLDINLGGFNLPIKEQYPSKWIIDIAKGMKIGLLIGTDAHDKKGLEYNLITVQKLIE